MPQYQKLTPNLLVSSVERSLAFYTDVLGFARGFSVPPEGGPLVFASVTSGAIEIFFNDAVNAAKEYPAFAGRPLGATGTMFIEVNGVDALYERLRSKAPVVMEIVTQWYGMREFAVTDPDGYVITFAERVG